MAPSFGTINIRKEQVWASTSLLELCLHQSSHFFLSILMENITQKTQKKKDEERDQIDDRHDDDENERKIIGRVFRGKGKSTTVRIIAKLFYFSGALSSYAVTEMQGNKKMKDSEGGVLLVKIDTRV